MLRLGIHLILFAGTCALTGTAYLGSFSIGDICENYKTVSLESFNYSDYKFNGEDCRFLIFSVLKTKQKLLEKSKNYLRVNIKCDVASLFFFENVV